MAQFELDVADLQSELRKMFRRLDQLDDAQQVVVGEVLVSQVVSPQLVRRLVPVARWFHIIAWPMEMRQ